MLLFRHLRFLTPARPKADHTPLTPISPRFTAIPPAMTTKEDQL